MSLEVKFHDLSEAVKGDVQERDAEISTAVNALVSRSHHFQLGPPGIAKSLLVDRIHLYMEGLNYFRWLLTKYTTPEEVFGPPDLNALRNEGSYIRNVENKLPWADIVFADEIFKGSSSILNAFLTAMNERLFMNPTAYTIPLNTMFGASNELPESDELNAMWDRLHFRHEVKALKAMSAVNTMLTNVLDPDPKPILSKTDLADAQVAAAQVEVPSDIIEGLLQLRGKLQQQGIEPTDRRWRESVGILQSQAFLAGRASVEPEDVSILIHVLWSNSQEIKPVQKTIYEFASPYDVEAMDMLSDLGLLRDDVNELEYKEMEVVKIEAASELYMKHQKIAVNLVKLKKKVKKAGKKSDLLSEVIVLFKQNCTILLKHMGLDPETMDDAINAVIESE